MGAAYRKRFLNVKSYARKNALFSLWLLLVGLLAAAPVAAAQDFRYGLLWKIEGRGVEPSYLFGTMHSEDPEVLRLPQPVQRAFEQAHGLTLEVVLDPQSLVVMSGGFLLGDGSTLKSHIGAPLYRRAVSAMAALGMPEAFVGGMKPWAVAVTLMTPPSRTGKVLDLTLYQRAIRAGKPVDGLETPMEQLGVFDDLSDKDQREMLKETLDHLGTLQDTLKTIKKAYLARDLQRLVEASDASMQGADPELTRRFNDRLITQRNHRMAERLQSRLREGGRFIAVGALHLPGKDGLLQLLTQQGYRLTRVY